MKVILSRKGFDSCYGKTASPVMPDGTLLSLPIPSKTDAVKFSDLYYNEESYYEIIKQLDPTTKITDDWTCHLDPDIRRGAIERPAGWIPSFGQESSALSHLRNQGVGQGDLFLFFGWFRKTEYADGHLSYSKDSQDQHIIYGWLQIGEMIEKSSDVPDWLIGHPHSNKTYWQNISRKGKTMNAIFVASERLSFAPELPGAGCLNFSDNLVLTKKNCKRRIWDLPGFMRNIPITYNAKAWHDEGFVSAARGQEFVFEANDDVIGWIKNMLRQ